MNKVHDYRVLEREFVTGDMSLRELCRAHDITGHSGVVVQAKKGGWAAKREAYHSRKSDRSITRLAEGAADREAAVRDHAIDVIDEALTKFSADIQATVRRQRAGEWVEEPLFVMTPRDVALLIDRLQVLFGKSSTISEGHSLSATISSEPLPVGALRQIAEMTRGLETPQTHASSGLPDHRQKRPD